MRAQRIRRVRLRVMVPRAYARASLASRGVGGRSRAMPGEGALVSLPAVAALAIGTDADMLFEDLRQILAEIEHGRHQDIGRPEIIAEQIGLGAQRALQIVEPLARLAEQFGIAHLPARPVFPERVPARDL